MNVNKHIYGVKKLCKVLGVPRSTYYAKLNHIASNREVENKKIKAEIIKIYKESKGRYGAPKIHVILIRNGFKISLKKTQKLMVQLGIRSIVIKKFKATPNRKVKEGLENVLKRDFSTTSINQKWVGDITYIKTQQNGWCYLASVLDLHSKKIIGYSFGKKMDNNLVLTALKNAYYTQAPDKSTSLIFHSDLGSQYTSNDMKELCYNLNITQSFSQKGCPYDNACIESFHAIIKKEEIYRNIYKTFEEAKIAIFKYIESWYNNKRLHSSIDYKTPNEFEKLSKNVA